MVSRDRVELTVTFGPTPSPLLSPVLAMAQCARGWLRTVGACRASFPVGPWPKCEVCPLFDPGWAAESTWSPATFPPGLGPVPDYPPER